MKECTLNGHKVVLYDGIDELPVVRFHRYNRYLLVDAGIGSDISDFDSHIERVVRYIRKGDNENAGKELENLRQNVFLIMSENNVRHLSFACLVKSIDGKPCDDLSDAALAKVVEMLGGATRGELADEYQSAKKKIDDELGLYFPKLFDDVRSREFYDLLKRLTMTNLEQVIKGEDEARQQQADKIQDDLMLFYKPKTFTGHDGLEVQHDRDFATMCLLISKETGTEAKTMTVLEYYNAYEYIKDNAQKSQQKARQTQNKAR